MNHTDTLVERLSVLFAETFHIEAPDSNTDLLESGILDSLQLVELLSQLELNFGLRIRIEDIDLDDLRSLSRLAQLVAENSGTAERART